MDVFKKIEFIKKKLEEHNFNEVYEEVKNSQTGGTPGETFMSVLYKLLDLKKSNIEAYKLVEEEIEEIISYAKSINYLR